MALESLLQGLRPGTQAALDAAGYSSGAGPFAAPIAQMPEAAAPDLTNRLLQIMSGQLGGTLTGGEKLSALGALLKSVSRGSQTSPQQVLQGIQQQKMQQVQGALQVQELRKQAQRQAQTEAYRQQLVAAETDPRKKAFLQIASADALDKIAADQYKGMDLEGVRAQLADLYGFGTPEYMEALKAVIEKSQTYTDASGRTWQVQPVSLPGLRGRAAAPTSAAADQSLAQQAREILKKRGKI